MSRKTLSNLCVFCGVVGLSVLPCVAQEITRGQALRMHSARLDPDSCVGSGVIDIGEFETWIRRRLDANVVGYGFAISEGGVPVGFGQGGFAQIPGLDNNVLFTPLTEIQVASVSKTITAIALVQLMEKLDVSADDAISPYLPESWDQGPGFKDWSLTFDDLLTHQTGFDQLIAQTINDADEDLPNPNTWEGLQLLVANGIPMKAAASSCPIKNDDGTFTLGGPEAPEGSHYGVYCYKNANYALARELIWRLAVQYGDLGAAFDEPDAKLMPMASASGYQQYVQDHVLAPAGVVGSCQAAESTVTRSLMYDVLGNVPGVMLTAGADAYSNDDSDLLACGPYNWSLSALDLVQVMGTLSCGELLSDASKDLMHRRKMGWSRSSDSATYPDRYWHSGRWTKTRSGVDQALWPPHPDHPKNDLTATADACVEIGDDLVCSATGSATNRIHSCVVEFPFGIDAALVLNSDLRDDPDVSACDVLLEAFEELF